MRNNNILFNVGISAQDKNTINGYQMLSGPENMSPSLDGAWDWWESSTQKLQEGISDIFDANVDAEVIKQTEGLQTEPTPDLPPPPPPIIIEEDPEPGLIAYAKKNPLVPIAILGLIIKVATN